MMKMWYKEKMKVLTTLDEKSASGVSSGITGTVSSIILDTRIINQNTRWWKQFCKLNEIKYASDRLWYVDRRRLDFKASFSGRKPLPVRPGMFLKAVFKVLATSMYARNL